MIGWVGPKLGGECWNIKDMRFIYPIVCNVLDLDYRAEPSSAIFYEKHIIRRVKLICQHYHGFPQLIEKVNVDIRI